MKHLYISLVFLISFSVSWSQTLLSGIVKDASTGERLIGAHIAEQANSNGTFTDKNGYFLFRTINDSKVVVSFVGYKSMEINYSPRTDTVVVVRLTADNQLEEITINAPQQQMFNSATLSNMEMKNIPSLGGKPDVLKVMQLMPGIKSQNEGSSRLLVRGGDPGQNLYLFDNVSLIYVNHLGGFTSVFNPDMINNIEIYKGGFPAQYGGKLSSIVDITQLEGNKTVRKKSYSIGITDASFAVEGPCRLKNSSFIVTGRKTLVDPLMLLASKLSDGGGYLIFYGFHDLNSKLTWQTSEKSTFNINFYYGDDYLNYRSKYNEMGINNKSRFTNMWGNSMLSVQNKRIVSPKLHFTNIVSYNHYRTYLKEVYNIQTNSEVSTYKSKYLSRVQDWSFRSYSKYQPFKNWKIDFGMQTSFLYTTVNQTIRQDVKQSGEKIPTLESAIYVENSLQFFNFAELIAGGRFIHYLSNELSKGNFEPRVRLNFHFTPHSTLNMSYMKTHQYSQLIFTSGDIMSNEIWVPADNQISPAVSEQFTAGVNANFAQSTFQTEMNVFYKTMHGLATYKEGFSNLAGDMNWRSKIETQGEGLAYGAECMLKKQRGKYTGFVAYSYSKSNRTYPNINNGNPYTFEYDRPHSFSFNINRKFSNHLNFNIVWVFQSGLPYTPVIGKHLSPVIEGGSDKVYDYYEVLIYGERNSSRMKNYHRLDISLIYSKLTKYGHKAEWNFSIYNLYNRRNPYYYYYNDTNSGEIYQPHNGESYKPLSMYQISFLPFIPTVSYKVYFDSSTQHTKIKWNERLKRWFFME